MASKPGSFLCHLAIFTVFLQVTVLAGTTSEQADDFDEELYSVIDSVRDGSLWTNSRQVRSIDLGGNKTNEGNGTNWYLPDNSLWKDLWSECRRKPSFSCVRTGVFKYLDKSLERTNDVSLTDSLYFRKNNNKLYGVCENSDEERDKCLRYNFEKSKVMARETATETSPVPSIEKKDVKDNETITIVESSGGNSTIEERGNEKEEETEEEGKKKKDSEGESKGDDENEDEEDITEGQADGKKVESLRDLSDILYDKGTNFLMTHDTEVQLPELFFGGGSIKIEPKSYVEGDENEEEGALVKIVFKPPPPSTKVVRGRVIHHLKKLFKKKLMHSFMALMLIIKMIKVKLMFLLPMIIGKATAKKLLLKVLLFLIPGLAHLFKLCHYYHTEHAKYHHHHHKVKHHHHHIQVPVPVPVPIHVDHHHNHVDGYGDKPTGGGYGGYDYPPYPPYPSHHHSADPGDSDYDYGGYNKDYGSVTQYSDNEAHLSSWGLGSSNIHEAGVLDAKNQPAYYKPNAGGYHYPDHVGSYSQRYAPKLQSLTPKPPLEGATISATYDPFYSPILKKIDAIFGQLAFNDEPCRERLICSMYKAPHRFSPHSNLLSHELSRDARDLQKPLVSNTAVLRFYRYVQAARDGQDKKDCLRLYPSCPVITE